MPSEHIVAVSSQVESGDQARSRGDLPSALRSYQAALLSAPGDIALRFRVASLLRELKRFDEAELALLELLSLAPDHVASLVELAQLAHAGGDLEAAVRHYQAAVQARPNDLGIHASLRNLLIEQSNFDWKLDIAKAVDILGRAASSPVDRMGAAVLLAQYGVTEGLEQEFAQLVAHFPLASEWRRMVRQLERSGLAKPRPRLGVAGNLDEDGLVLSFGVTEKPVEGSDTLLVVFGGANHRLGLSFDIIQRILRPTGVSTLYVRDLERTWYLGGIVGLGTGFAAAAEGLRQTAARLKARRILALANCVGCAGAIRYGLAIGAEAVLGLSPRIRIPAMPAANATLRDRIERLRDADPLLADDIRDQYAAADVRPALNLVYGADCPDDAADVLHMQGIAGVTGAPISKYPGHASLHLLFGRGLLTPLLHEFVRTGGVGPELLASIESAFTRTGE